MKAPLSIAAIIGGLAALSAGLEAQSKFVYTNNDLPAGNSVSAFVDNSGVLSEIANSPFSTGGNGTGGGFIAVDRVVVAGGKFLYASNDGSQTIAAFAIASTTGALAPVPTSPYSDGASTGNGDISLAVSPDGQSLFAGVAANNTVVRFKINADGSLSQVASAAVPAAPIGMRVSGDGNYLAIGVPAYLNFGGIALYSIANGALTLVNNMPFIGTGAVTGVDINCAGSLVVGGVISSTAEIVDSYTLSAGSLTRVQGSPLNSTAAKGSNVVVLSPDDAHLFVSNQFSASITSFSVASTGLLTMAGSPVSLGAGNTAGIATDQTGTTLYASNGTNQIFVFDIAADGTLSAVAGSPFTTNQTGGVLSLAAFPGKACAAGAGGGLTGFADFSITILNGDPHTFHEEGAFTLGAGSTIFPPTQPVSFTYGAASIALPPDSFQQSGNATHFLFDGTIDGVHLHIDINGEGNSSTMYKFTVDGNGLDLTGQLEPITVGLQIGTNAGSLSFQANLHH